MSHAGNGRALTRLEEKKSPKPKDPWMAAYLKANDEVNREWRAAWTFAKFARQLAGTDGPPPMPLPAEGAAGSGKPAPRAPRPPRGVRAVWSETVRPGPHDILTFQEAMQVPWHDGSRQHPYEAEGRQGPWANWGFIGPPSDDEQEAQSED